ncbi:alpha/beta hydrolase [Clavibacter sp. VKM Ac-2873]|nr:alpha/beta hydrolase [Clavibacter sp. VKM Ac-2873]MBF4617873.1 alpha/beta hydrolase [Clavibacter sp. VKM Ac-2873]
MRRPLRITLRIVAVLVALPVLTLATTAIVNAVATPRDLAAIAPYGERVPVDGKEMNVVDSGTGDPGAETIVLLPGLGTAAPALDFQPLISALDDTHRVVAVEPFGTGLSDQTDTPRTAAAIVDEVHAALQHLGVDRYVLMGHSISGVYALEYAERYGDELTAFVGIDSSVPDQPGWDAPAATDGLTALRDLGILRVLNAVGGDAYAGLPYDDATKEQMRLLATRNATAPTLLDEMDRVPEAFASVSGETFPADLPVLLFVVPDAAGGEGWVALHEAQAASVEHGEVIPLDGDHYLHRTRSPEIAAATEEFLASLPAR